MIDGTNGLPSVPQSLASITPEWLAAAIGGPIINARCGPVVRGTATKAIFVATYALGADARLPRSVCIKGGFDEPHAAQLAEMGSYIIEGRFYRDIRPELTLDTPKTYSVHFDEAQGHCVIVMEDLLAAGAQFLRAPSDVLSPDEAHMLLRDLADLHARWWNVKPPQWLETGILPTSSMGRYFRTYTPDNIAEQLESRATGLPPRLRDPVLLHDAFWRLENRSDNAPLCVLHGDAHLGNIYRRACGRVALCDWQAMFVGRWSHDVAYLIGSGLDPAMRGHMESDLLLGYLDALRAADVDAPPLDLAWIEYRRAMLYGLYGWLTNPLYFQPEEISSNMTERFAVAVVELGTIDLLLNP